MSFYWSFSSKRMQVFVSFFFFFFFFGCYSNSHIRTQRVLQEGEKVFSVSGAFNGVGGIDDRAIYRKISDEWQYRSTRVVEPYAPVAAIRGEYSVLEGYKKGELGYSVGGGINALVNEGVIGFIGGEYNKYLQPGDKRPLKAGVSLELNRTTSGLFALHSIQSIKTTTSKKAPLFFGVHTLFSKFDELDYKQTTRGFGVSSGAEQFFSSRSIILQLDVSFVKNNINNLDKSFYLSSRNSSWRPIVSASVALTFSPKSFKKKTILKRTDSAKSQLFKNKAVLKKQLVKEFDPETGDPIEKKSTDVIFDPETGELIDQ